MTVSRRRLGDALVVAAVLAVDLLVWGGRRELVGGGLLPVWAVPLASAAVCALLLARWRRPVPVWATTWAFALVNLALPAYYPFAPLLVALHAVASRTGPTVARLALLATAVPLGLFTWRSGAAAAAGTAPYLQAAAVWAVVAGVVWGLGRLTWGAARRARDERERLARDAEAAVDAERRRLARELHDSVTGAVTAMLLNAAGARAHLTADAGRARDALATVEQAGVQAMNELHRMLGLLREPAPEAPGPSLAELDALIDRTRRGGTDVAVEVVGAGSALDPSVDLAAYRIVQESLTNAVKHGGGRVVVCLDWRPSALHLDVRSTAGPPPSVPPPSSGLGLVGLRERVHLIGGTFRAGPTPDGWLVHAELPLGGPAPQLAVPDGRGAGS